MLKEICNENPETMAAYKKLTDEQKANAEIGCYLIGQALYKLIPFINSAIEAVSNFSKTVIELYPNKRVVHLALHGKRRTRKKNMKRIYKWFNREADNGREQS